MIKFFLLLFVLLISCNENINNDLVTPNQKMLPNNIMTEDDAKEKALELLQRSNTKANFGMTVTVMRASSTKSCNETLRYVINFDNNQGYVILDSDNRVPVLALSEVGMFDPDTKNPGVLLFMKAADEYAKHSIEEFDSLIQIIESEIANPYIIGPNTDRLVGYNHKTSYVYNPESTDKVAPLLRTEWHQDFPFNGDESYYKCNTHNEWFSTGCGVTMVSQILNYHRYPVQIENPAFSWSSINQNRYCNGLTPNGVLSINALMKYTRTLILAGKVHNQSTHVVDTKSENIKRLQNIGYTADAWNVSYSDYFVRKSLKNRMPVMILAQNALPDGGGHGWILDGYYPSVARYIRTYEVWMRPDGTKYEIFSSEKFDKYLYLYHCNWGWNALNGTNDNGYFNELWSVRKYQFSDAVMISHGVRPV